MIFGGKKTSDSNCILGLSGNVSGAVFFEMPIFAKKWPKMVEKWVKMIFLDHGVNRKVVDNDKNYPNMNFEKNQATRSRENLQKPQKPSFLGIKGPKKFFSDFSAKIGLVHFFPIIMI